MNSSDELVTITERSNNQPCEVRHGKVSMQNYRIEHTSRNPRKPRSSLVRPAVLGALTRPRFPESLNPDIVHSPVTLRLDAMCLK